MKTETSFGQPQAPKIDAAEVRAHADDLKEFFARLRPLSERARKLLASIAELAYHGRGQQRKPDVAYLPELYESCGLGVEEMYPLLNELREQGLIEVEEKYPFEDVKIAAAQSGSNPTAAIVQLCQGKGISLRDVLVDLRFELLQ